MKKATLIFVWIGKYLPFYAIESLLFAKQNNSSRDVLICLSRKPSSTICQRLEKEGIKVFIIENEKNKLHLDLNIIKLFSSDFLINTSLRFVYLDYLIKHLKINEFFHAELDNAVFKLDGLEKKLDQFGDGLFVPRDAKNRAIASLFYCNRTQSLSELILLYSKTKPPKNDMDALAIYSCDYPEHFFSLPTESYLMNKKYWNLIDPKNCDGLFDAAAIGQYMLGVDPIHRKGKPSYNLFVNENSKINWNRVIFATDEQKIFLNITNKISDNYQLYNLHIHSKNWKAFKSLLTNGNILKKLNKGKKSIISGRIFIYFGWVYVALILIKKFVKKLL